MEVMEQLRLSSELIDNYNRYAEGLDSKNWSQVRSCFSDIVYIDYGAISAPTGSPEEPRQADDWLLVLQGVINGFDFTRHTITNHRFQFDRDRPSCRTYLVADHVIYQNPEIPIAGPAEIATVIGEYCNSYEQQPDGRWTICRSALDIQCSTGNAELFATAMQRAAAANGTA